jgi:L-fucose mutarotase
MHVFHGAEALINSCKRRLDGMAAVCLDERTDSQHPNFPDIMLKGIHPCISPELLKTLAEMGHGDEIILADAHFPGHSFKTRVLRADGLDIATLLDGILPLFELDSYAEPLVMMQAVKGDVLDPAVEEQYMAVTHRHVPNAAVPVRLDRFAFYDRAQTVFAIIMTGERRKYGNLLLKKGVTPVSG